MICQTALIYSNIEGEGVTDQQKGVQMKRQAPKQRGFFRWYLQSTCRHRHSAPRFALSGADNHSEKDLLTQIRLAFLNSGHDHVYNTSRVQAIEPLLNPFHQYDVEVLRPRPSCMSATLHSSWLLPPVDRVTSWTSSHRSSIPTLISFLDCGYKI